MASRSAIDLQATFTGTQEVREPHRFDEAALEKYLSEHLPGFAAPLEVREFKGGQSNPTYELRTGGRRFALRRKPPGKLLKSAHAVDREFRVIHALNRVDFPVPTAHVLCEDENVIGTIFYVMECVDGRVLWDTQLREQTPSERHAIFDSMSAILARLHTVDYEAVGLGEFGRPGNYFARQIGRWSKQYVASETEDVPSMNRLMEWLPENIPHDESTSIVHGDYKLDNMVTHASEPRVIAILDWELSTIGHPLGDLTYLISHRRAPGSFFLELSERQVRELGFPTEQEWVDTYCERTGRDGVPHFAFYMAYQLFRSACILQGIRGRVRDGTASSEHAATMASSVEPLGDSALSYARELGA